MQVIFFHHHRADSADAFVDYLRFFQQTFRPADLFFKAEPLYKLFIIRIIILFLERGKPVEAFDEQSLSFEVGKTQRSCNFRHAERARPFLRLVEKRGGNLFVVHAVEAGKSNSFPVPFRVGSLLVNTRNSAANFAVFIGVKIYRVRLVAVNVIFAEQLFFVRVEGRHEIRLVLVKFKRKLDKVFYFLSCFNFSDFYHSEYPTRINI